MMKAMEIRLLAAIRITGSNFIQDVIVRSQKTYFCLNIYNPEKRKVSRQKGIPEI